jgi:ribosome maturation protein SDO1
MTDIIAKLHKEGKHFEIMVDSDKALALKKTGKGFVADMMTVQQIFHDIKKGVRASDSDLEKAFNTSDVFKIAEKIIKEGELHLPSEYKTKERDEKLKQVVDYITRTCIDPRTSMPLTPQRIESAIKETGIRIDEKKSVEEQFSSILNTIQKLLPIRFETKKISIRIPASLTANAYGLVKGFIMKEDWKDNGDLEVVVQLPKATLMEFFDKLNRVTHGSAITKELA